VIRLFTKFEVRRFSRSEDIGHLLCDRDVSSTLVANTNTSTLLSSKNTVSASTSVIASHA